MNYANNAYSVLSGGISDVATVINVAAGTGSRFPASNFLATLVGYDVNGNENAWEIVLCTSRTSDALTVTRAQEGTTAVAWEDATRIENRVTAGTMAAFEPGITAGTTEQYLRGDKSWQSLNKSAVGLGNVDNTSDANKPISTATQTALDAKAPLANPTFTGLPNAPTAAAGTNTTQLATTAYVVAERAATATLTNKTLTTPVLTGTREVRVAMPANAIDLSTGNVFTKTISGATTLTVSNTPTTGAAASFILELTNAGSAGITWFSGVKWAGGTAPTLTASGVDVLGFYTWDGGTTWRGFVLSKDSK